MSVCYYVLHYLQDYEGVNDTFLTSLVVGNMPFTKEDYYEVQPHMKQSSLLRSTGQRTAIS